MGARAPWSRLTLSLQWPVPGHCPTYSGCEIDAPLVFLLKANVWGFAVQANPKAFQLILNYLLMSQGLQDIQDNQDQITRSGH